MQTIKINPAFLKGEIKIPPSKSISHRAIICAGLSEGESLIENIILSKDILATIKAMEAFGVKIKQLKTDEKGIYNLLIKGREKLELLRDEINCQESGSTLRFLIPMAGLVEGKVSYIGKGKLVERPLEPYYEIFRQQNISYSNDEGKLPLTIEGQLKPGLFHMKGNVSSQFITGLLFVLPILNGDSKIVLTTNLESKGYVDLTIDMLKRFSIEIGNNDYKEFIIKGNQKYKANNYKVEGDFSQAAFFIVAGLLGEEIKCKGLNINSLQGDKAILDIVKDMGGNISINKDVLESKKSTSKAITIDASQCPDLVPILAVLGSFSKGTTKIINASRLRIKESDRLKAISRELNKIGADVKELEDGLEIKGKKNLLGGTVNSWNDHRIAMALAIASLKCKNPVIIEDSAAVEKSYPQFWEDFKSLGGEVYEWNLGR